MEDPSASGGGQFGFQGGNTKMGVKWRDRHKQRTHIRSLSNSPADTAMWTESKRPCPGHRHKSINVRTWAPWVGRAVRGENVTEVGTVLLDAWEGEWCGESQMRFWTLTTHSTGLISSVLMWKPSRAPSDYERNPDSFKKPSWSSSSHICSIPSRPNSSCFLNTKLCCCPHSFFLLPIQLLLSPVINHSLNPVRKLIPPGTLPNTLTGQML